MIYFARIDIGDFTTRWTNTHQAFFIKIGCSNQPQERINQLKNEYEKPVTLLAVAFGGIPEETAMLDRFRHLQIPRKYGQIAPDWFFPTRELIDFIGSLPAIDLADYDRQSGCQKKSRILSVWS